MDRVVFSISKTDQNNYVLENKMDHKSYKFKEFSDIIDVFCDTNNPKLSGGQQGSVPGSYLDTIDIHKRVVEGQKQNTSKYFWSKSYDKFDQLEKVSVVEVLLQVKKNMKNW